MTNDRVKTRAYFLWLHDYGSDDLNRYYMAQKIDNRLKIEKGIDIVSKLICKYCNCRYGNIIIPYLPPFDTICYQCYFDNSKEELIEQTFDII